MSKIKITAFASHEVTGAESRYWPTELELFGVIWALKRVKSGYMLKQKRREIKWPEEALPQLQPGEIVRIPPESEIDAILFTDDFADIDERSYKKNAIKDMRAAPGRQNNNAKQREDELVTSIAQNRNYLLAPYIPRKP